MMSKLAHQQITAQLAPIEERDRQAARELGFAKVAQEMGMDESTYTEFREFALKQQAAGN